MSRTGFRALKHRTKMEDTPKALADLRLKIAAIDGQILSLVKERLDFCREMTPLKLTHQVPFQDLDQEQTVLQRSATWAKTQGEDSERAQGLTRFLMDWGLFVQEK